MTGEPARRADLDWLRVLAFGLLIFYHAGMAWSGWNWHITSRDSIEWLREAMRFLNRWRMPLIFVVSGAAIMHALGKRSASDFAIDRVCRLLLPLAVGMVVLVPPQDYLALKYGGLFEGSFLQFLAETFSGAYPAGKLRAHHLWFLGYVLLLTFILLPVFLWLRSPAGRSIHLRAARSAGQRGLHWLMPLPLAVAMLWLSSISGSNNGYSFAGPWYGFSYYGVLLLYGALIFGSSDLLAALCRQRHVSLGIGIVAYAAFYGLYVRGAVQPSITRAELPAYAVLSAVNTMAWLFAIVGFAQRHLRSRPPYLSALTEAVYPAYLLHQTIAMFAVYWLLRLGAPPVLGFSMAVAATFVGTAIAYAVFVRPFWFMRPLFGLKAEREKARDRPSASDELDRALDGATQAKADAAPAERASSLVRPLSYERP